VEDPDTSSLVALEAGKDNDTDYAEKPIEPKKAKPKPKKPAPKRTSPRKRPSNDAPEVPLPIPKMRKILPKSEPPNLKRAPNRQKGEIHVFRIQRDKPSKSNKSTEEPEAQGEAQEETTSKGKKSRRKGKAAPRSSKAIGNRNKKGA
jgi:hypothetical protein